MFAICSVIPRPHSMPHPHCPSLPSDSLSVPPLPQTFISAAPGVLPASNPALLSSLPTAVPSYIPAAVPNPCCHSPTLLLSPSPQLPSTSLHPSSDYSKGFGGRYGVERDKVDKAAVGFDYKSQTEKHDSQKGDHPFLSPEQPIEFYRGTTVSTAAPRSPC